MKKIFMLIGVMVFTLLIGGCVIEKKSNVIYTTNYPITYIVTYLYGTNDNIESIYPNETNINDYKLTKKAIKEFSNANIFIYNGLSNEKDYAKKLINSNHGLNIIDAGENLKYTYDIKETWLSPNNFIMLCKNIKNRLVEISTSQDEIKTINENFKSLEQDVSIMDAYLRTVAKEATKDDSKPVLVAATSDFKYLEEYGFNVIALDEDLSEATLTTIKANFKNDKYNKILAFEGYKNTDLVNEIVNDYDAKITTINPLYTISNDDVAKNETYISLMNSYIETIRSVVS